MRTSTAILFSCLWFTPVAAADCQTDTFDDTPYTICAADPDTDDLRLWLDDDQGQKIGTFSRLEDLLASSDQQLVFAMNGGMYHPDRGPVGHYVENGVESQRIITSDGPGNFGLLPNGVFCFGKGYAAIVESRAYADDPPNCQFASQSGPMLVIDGALHPKFLPNSTSRFIRNGVGVTNAGRVFAVISDAPVTFHEFARLFKDHLHTPNALYMDGNVSRAFARDLDRHDRGFPMGPMLGVAAPAD